MDLIVVRENTECLVRRYSLTVLPYTHPVAQYIKQETLEDSPSGKQAKATRLITERASRRIGEMAFKLAAERPRKARLFLVPSFPPY